MHYMITHFIAFVYRIEIETAECDVPVAKEEPEVVEVVATEEEPEQDQGKHLCIFQTILVNNIDM